MNFKTILLVPALLLFSISAMSFHVKYTLLNGPIPAKGLNIIKTNSGYITCGTILNGEEVFLKATDHTGAVLWAYQYNLIGSDARAFDIIEKSDHSGYLVCGYLILPGGPGANWKTFVMEVDLSGSPVNAFYFEQLNGPALNIEATHNNEYMLVGFISDSYTIGSTYRRGYAAKIDLTGNIIWSWFHDGNLFSGNYNDFDMAESIEVIEEPSLNGGYGYFISGSVTATWVDRTGPMPVNRPIQKVLAVLLDDFGNQLWNRSFAGYEMDLREIGVDSEYDPIDKNIFLLSNNDDRMHGFCITTFTLAGSIVSRMSTDIKYGNVHAAHFPASCLFLENGTLKVFGYGMLAYKNYGTLHHNPYYPYEMHLDAAHPHNMSKYTIYPTNNAGATLGYNGLLEIYPSMGYIAPTIYTPEMALTESGEGTSDDFCVVTLSDKLEPVLISNDVVNPCVMAEVDSVKYKGGPDTPIVIAQDLEPIPGPTIFLPIDITLPYVDSVNCCICLPPDSSWYQGLPTPTVVNWLEIEWDSVDCADSFYIEIFDWWGTKVNSVVTSGHSYLLSNLIIPNGDEFYYLICSICDGDTVCGDTVFVDFGSLKKGPNGLATIGQNSSDIKIFPNPSNGIVNFRVPSAYGECHVILTDVLGKRLQELDIKPGTSQIDLSPYKNGKYLLEIRGSNKRETVQLEKRE